MAATDVAVGVNLDPMSYVYRTAAFIAVVVIVFGAMVALQRVLGVISYSP